MIYKLGKSVSNINNSIVRGVYKYDTPPSTSKLVHKMIHC